MAPIGPRPRTTTVPPPGIPAYSTDCQAVGSTSDSRTNRPSGGLSGTVIVVLRLRHAEELGLPARHSAVEP
jgi:hypothetical protein